MSPYNSVDEVDVVNELRDALADGEQRDGLGGGISPHVIAERMGRGVSSVRKRLADARDHGTVVQVTGIKPNGKPRTSYLPADHPDADGGDVPGVKS